MDFLPSRNPGLLRHDSETFGQKGNDKSAWRGKTSTERKSLLRPGIVEVFGGFEMSTRGILPCHQPDVVEKSRG